MAGSTVSGLLGWSPSVSQAPACWLSAKLLYAFQTHPIISLPLHHIGSKRMLFEFSQSLDKASMEGKGQ